MKISKLYITIGMIIAFALFFELAAHADESDQATTLTFNEPIQIPGQILPAGTYLFKLAGDSDRDVVEVFNADRSVLYATLLTIAAERPEPTGHTVISLAQQGANQPDALVKWFYPGDETGHEFLYTSQKEKELAHDTQRTVVTDQPTNANSDTSRAGN